MARYTGGDITEIVCKHPTVGEVRFQAKSNESFTFDPGGVRSNDDSNMITGGGEMIDQMNVVRWSAEGPVVVDNRSGNEQEKVPELMASPELGTWTVTHIDGTIWKGKGKPVGDVNIDTNTAQMTLKIAGSGKMEKI